MNQAIDVPGPVPDVDETIADLEQLVATSPRATDKDRRDVQRLRARWEQHKTDLEAKRQRLDAATAALDAVRADDRVDSAIGERLRLVDHFGLGVTERAVIRRLAGEMMRSPDLCRAVARKRGIRPSSVRGVVYRLHGRGFLRVAAWGGASPTARLIWLTELGRYALRNLGTVTVEGEAAS